MYRFQEVNMCVLGLAMIKYVIQNDMQESLSFSFILCRQRNCHSWILIDRVVASYLPWDKVFWTSKHKQLA